MSELDQERVEQLSMEILKMLKANFKMGPAPDRMRVLEALNALGIAVGTVIGGTMDPEALSFFTDAMFRQLQEVAVDQAKQKRSSN